jgi:hypothetical protein
VPVPEGPATIVWNEDEASRLAPQRTFLIFGLRRGGTTSVALAARELGLYLGEQYAVNLEDQEFREFKGVDSIRATIAARNAAHDVWGWKHPQPLRYFETIYDDLRNPRFIFVTRDMTATALGIAKREVMTADAAINDVATVLGRNLALLRQLKRPALFVSYEKLLLRPEAVIREMAGFLGMACDEGTCARITGQIVPGRYQPESRYGWRGKLRDTARIWLTS